jgi:hypothetical protein
MSYLRITLFFWGQNRMGNVIPIATAFIRDARLNMDVQVFVRGFCGFFIPLMPIILVEGDRRRIAILAFSVVCIFLSFSPYALFILFALSSPWGVGCLLFCIGLRFLRARTESRAGTFVLLTFALLFTTLAFFANLALALFALPYYAAHIALRYSRTECKAITIQVVAFATNYVLMKYCGTDHYSLIEFSWGNFVRAYQGMQTRLALVPIFLLVAGALILCLVERVRSFRSETSWSCHARSRLAVVFACVCYFIIVPNISWVRLNEDDSRYFIWIFAIAIAVSAGIYVDSASRALRSLFVAPSSARSHIAAAAFAMAALAIICYRTNPSPSRCDYLDGGLQARAFVRPLVELAARSKVDFVVGDYWLVWPIVFGSIVERQSNGEMHPLVFGFAYRGKVVGDLIASKFEQDAANSALCVDIAATECSDRLIEYGSPRFRNCFEFSQSGSIGERSYIVLRTKQACIRNSNLYSVGGRAGE